MTSLIERLAEIESQFNIKHGIIKSPGKFEGETVATVYFYEASLDGDGETIAINQDERDFLGIPDQYKYVKVIESNDGFVSLDYLTKEEYYKQEFESDEEDEDDFNEFAQNSIDLDDWSNW